MNEGDLKHVEALMSRRDHSSLMSLPSERQSLYMELADEVPSLVAEVRRLNLQKSELESDLMRLMTAVGPYSTVESAIKFATKTRQQWAAYHEALEIALPSMVHTYSGHEDPSVWVDGCGKCRVARLLTDPILLKAER